MIKVKVEGTSIYDKKPSPSPPLFSGFTCDDGTYPRRKPVRSGDKHELVPRHDTKGLVPKSILDS